MKKNSRSHLQVTKYRLVVWFLIILFSIGLGLIWIIYGFESAILGLLCLLGMAIPIGLIALVLFGLEKFVKEE